MPFPQWHVQRPENGLESFSFPEKSLIYTATVDWRRDILPRQQQWSMYVTAAPLMLCAVTTAARCHLKFFVRELQSSVKGHTNNTNNDVLSTRHLVANIVTLQ